MNQLMFVFDYLLRMFAQNYVYPLHYGVVMGCSYPQEKKIEKRSEVNVR